MEFPGILEFRGFDGIGLRVVAPAFCPMMTEPKKGSKRERKMPLMSSCDSPRLIIRSYSEWCRAVLRNVSCVSGGRTSKRACSAAAPKVLRAARRRSPRSPQHNTRLAPLARAMFNRSSASARLQHLPHSIFQLRLILSPSSNRHQSCKSHDQVSRPHDLRATIDSKLLRPVRNCLQLRPA